MEKEELKKILEEVKSKFKDKFLFPERIKLLKNKIYKNNPEKNIWDNITLPHIQYICPEDNLSMNAIYEGGELDTDLIINKEYKIYTVLYSPNRNTKPILEWACFDKENMKTFYKINIKNFSII